MEFEYTGTIYIDIDKIFEICCEDNLIDADDIRMAVNEFTTELEDDTYYHIEGWMVDEIVTAVKKRIDKELNA